MTLRRRRWTFASRFSRRGLLRDADGSVAVEFGLVVLPFCFMIFAILEVVLIFTLDSVLENAAINTGRLVRTGQAEAQGMTAAQFKSELCSRMSIFSADCIDRATIDVRVVPLFNAPTPDPLANGPFNPGGLGYTNGSPGNFVLVRVWYRHTLLTTFLSQGLSHTGDRTAMLTATTAFKNEPAGGWQPPPPVTP